MSDINTKIPQKLFLYAESILFVIVVSVLMLFQTNILLWLFNTQLPFTGSNALLIISNNNWLEVFTKQLTNGTVLVTIFIILEVVLFLAGIGFSFVQLWQIKKRKQWAKGENFLLVAYIALLVGTLICGAMVVTTSIQTITTLESIFQKVSPSEFKTLGKNLMHFFENETVSLKTIFGDLTALIKGTQKILSGVQEVGKTPTLILKWLEGLKNLYSYFIVCFSGSSLLIILGSILSLNHGYPRLIETAVKKRTAPSSDVDERLVKILEQQQELIEKLNQQVMSSSPKNTREKNELEVPR